MSKYSQKSDSYIYELDGLRGVAVLGVLLFHAVLLSTKLDRLLLLVSVFRVGTDVFLILSGFLITRILLRSKGDPHYFRNFYMRRGLRIWPLYWAVLLVVFLYFTFTPHELTARDLHLEYYAFFLQSLILPVGPFALFTTWTLAMIEEFYFIWPAAVRFCGKRTLVVLLFALIVFCPVYRECAVLTGQSSTFIHAFTLCRLDALLWGALLSIISIEKYASRWRWAAAGAFAVTIVPATWYLAMGYENALGYSLTSLCAVSIVVVTLASRENHDSWPRLLLSAKLRHLGKISYGIYLLQGLVMVVYYKTNLRARIGLMFGVPGELLNIVIAGACVILCASVSYAVFEKPILGLKRLFPRRTGPAEVTARDAEVFLVTAAQCVAPRVGGD